MDSEKTVAVDLMPTNLMPTARLSSKAIQHRRPAARCRSVCMALAWALCIPNFASFAAAAQAPGNGTYAVVISGLGGEPAYGKLIDQWGKDLSSVLRKNAVSEDRVFWLAANKEMEGVYAESRREEIVKLMEELAARLTAEDTLVLFLIGHGSYDDYDYRFNLPGPDLTASQLSDLLGDIRAGKQVVVNMTSSSGASLEPLQRKGRVVITATSAGRERNFSVFARYFTEALDDPAADTNKNRELSVLEAFQYASHEVARYYKELTRLATEHALLEDQGDGEGVREATPENGQGLLASSIPLVDLGGRTAADDDPQARALRAKKRKIEEAIEQLKYRKASLTSKQYFERLEKLLIDLAKVEQNLENLVQDNSGENESRNGPNL